MYKPIRILACWHHKLSVCFVTHNFMSSLLFYVIYTTINPNPSYCMSTTQCMWTSHCPNQFLWFTLTWCTFYTSNRALFNWAVMVIRTQVTRESWQQCQERRHQTYDPGTSNKPGLPNPLSAVHFSPGRVVQRTVRRCTTRWVRAVQLCRCEMCDSKRSS